MAKAAAPAELQKLVDRFHTDRRVSLSPDYKEEQLRLEFFDPLFSAFGSDMVRPRP